jgi:hypothetical protein
MKRVTASILLAATALTSAFAYPRPELRLAMPATADTSTKWISTGWVMGQSTLTGQTFNASNQNGSTTANVYASANYGVLRAGMELTAQADANSSVGAVGGSGDEPAVQSSDTLLVRSEEYTAPDGVTYPALPYGTEVPIDFTVNLTPLMTPGVLTATELSYGEFIGTVDFVSAGPAGDQQMTSTVKTIAGSSFVVPVQVLSKVFTVHAWVGGTIQINSALIAQGAVTETAGDTPESSNLCKFDATFTLVIEPLFEGVSVKSLSGAIY